MVAHYPDGNSDFVVVRKKDIEKRRNNSDAWRRNKSTSPWGQWPVEMALKTGIRYAISRGLVYLDEQSSRAFEQDGIQDAPPQQGTSAVAALEVNQQTMPTGMTALTESVKELVDHIPDEHAANPASLVDAGSATADHTADI